MKFQHGVLRSEQAPPKNLKSDPFNRKLGWPVYLPVILLALIALSLIVALVLYLH